MDKQIKAQTKWVNLYLETKDASFVCRKCGISRPTLRKWHRRYLKDGLQGLVGLSKKPHSSPNHELTSERIKLILNLRNERNLGARRIQTELIRLHSCSLSLASIHKALTTQQAQPIKKLKRKKKFKRYSRPIPGDRIQMDTCKIAPVFEWFQKDLVLIDSPTRRRLSSSPSIELLKTEEGKKRISHRFDKC